MEYELVHSYKGTGWKKHKYISKYTKNGKTVYVYANSGYALNRQNPNSTDDEDSDDFKEKAKKVATDFAKYTARELTHNGRRFISKLFQTYTIAKYKIKEINKPTSTYLKEFINKKTSSKK